MPPAAVPTGNDSDPAVNEAIRSRILWAIPGVPALAMSGQTTVAFDIGSEVLAEHMRFGGDIGTSSPGIHLVTLGFALQEQGEFAKANEVLTLGYEASSRSGGLLGQAWFGLSLGRLAMLTAQPQIARRWAKEVLAVTAANRWLGARQLALPTLAGASALLGDMETARRAMAEATTHQGKFNFLLPDRPR